MWKAVAIAITLTTAVGLCWPRVAQADAFIGVYTEQPGIDLSITDSENRNQQFSRVNDWSSGVSLSYGGLTLGVSQSYLQRGEADDHSAQDYAFRFGRNNWGISLWYQSYQGLDHRERRDEPNKDFDRPDVKIQKTSGQIVYAPLGSSYGVDEMFEYFPEKKQFLWSPLIVAGLNRRFISADAALLQTTAPQPGNESIQSSRLDLLCGMAASVYMGQIYLAGSALIGSGIVHNSYQNGALISHSQTKVWSDFGSSEADIRLGWRGKRMAFGVFGRTDRSSTLIEDNKVGLSSTNLGVFIGSSL